MSSSTASTPLTFPTASYSPVSRAPFVSPACDPGPAGRPPRIGPDRTSARAPGRTAAIGGVR